MSPVTRDALAVGGGFLVGLISGSLGLGGGILFVPMMVIGFGFAQKVAQGTSLVAIIPAALVGALTHDRSGQMDRRAAVLVGATGCLGSLAGALAAIRLPRELLARLFGAVLLYSAYRLWTAPNRARKPT